MRITPEGKEGIRLNTFIFTLIIAVVTATALCYDWAWWVIALVDGFLLWRIIFVVRFFRDRKDARGKSSLFTFCLAVPLMFAALSGDKELTGELLSLGLRGETVDRQGRSALDFAISGQCTDCIELLQQTK